MGNSCRLTLLAQSLLNLPTLHPIIATLRYSILTSRLDRRLHLFALRQIVEKCLDCVVAVKRLAQLCSKTSDHTKWSRNEWSVPCIRCVMCCRGLKATYPIKMAVFFQQIAGLFIQMDGCDTS
jgi:hypothetical protein